MTLGAELALKEAEDMSYDMLRGDQILYIHIYIYIFREFYFFL
jgi:hypothetical protein